MRHPTDGTLRRLLDEPAGVGDADRTHVAGCAHCLDTVETFRADADRVSAALATDTTPDVDAAWRRLTSTPATAPATAAAAVPQRSRGWRDVLRRPVVAVATVGLVLAGAGTAAANGWLPMFQTEKVAPLTLSTADLVALPDLSSYGDVSVDGVPAVHDVADAAAAAAETALDVPQVRELPRGVSGEPTIQVGGELRATFTFDAEKAARAAAAAGEELPAPPSGVDGSQVRLVAGPGVAQVWHSDAGAPALIVGRAVAPKAESSGAPFEVVRDYLLTLPGLPDDVAAQLRTYAADGSTLPLPVPAEEVSTATADVNGTTATVLTARSGALAAVVWVNDGVMTVVAGSLDTDEVLTVARELG